MSETIVFTTQSQRRLIPAGRYEGQFNSFQSKEGGAMGFQFLLDGQGSAWKWFNPATITEATRPSYEAALRATLAACGAKVPEGPGSIDFDPEACIGQRVLVDIVHRERNGTTYDNVAAVRPVPETDEVEEVPEG